MADYCEAWPDNLKSLSRLYYRAQQRVRNLEAHVERVDPDGFYAVMLELEKAIDETQKAADAFRKARQAWDTESGVFAR